MAKRGQEWLLTPARLKKARRLAALGLFEHQIAACLGICQESLINKKKQYPELAVAIEEGHAEGVERMAARLERMAKTNPDLVKFYLARRAQWVERSAVDLSVTGVTKEQRDAAVRAFEQSKDDADA